MSVEIRFEQDGGHGLVATGSSLWEAAKRLGVHLRADCSGRGECDACAVVIMTGAELLSPVNDREEKILGAERLGTAQRLACQTTLDRTGAVAVRSVAVAAGAKQQQESGKVFRELPLGNQVGALIELQAIAITEAVNTLRGKSNALIEKFLNLKSQTANTKEQPGGTGDSPEGNSQGERRETESSEQRD